MTAGSGNWRRLTAGIVALLMCGLALVVVHTRESFGVWSPFTPPDRFQFCGVRYHREGTNPQGSTVSRAQAMRTGQATYWTRAATVGLARWQVYRTSTWPCPESEDRNGGGRTTYIKVGADRHLVMNDAN